MGSDLPHFQMCPIPLLQNTIPSQNRLLPGPGIAKYHEENPEVNRLCAHAKAGLGLSLPNPGNLISDFNEKRSEVTFLMANPAIIRMERLCCPW